MLQLESPTSTMPTMPSIDRHPQDPLYSSAICDCKLRPRGLYVKHHCCLIMALVRMHRFQTLLYVVAVLPRPFLLPQPRPRANPEDRTVLLYAKVSQRASHTVSQTGSCIYLPRSGCTARETVSLTPACVRACRVYPPIPIHPFIHPVQSIQPSLAATQQQDKVHIPNHSRSLRRHIHTQSHST